MNPNLWYFVWLSKQTKTNSKLKMGLPVNVLPLTKWLLEPPQPMAPRLDIVSVKRALGSQPSRT